MSRNLATSTCVDCDNTTPVRLTDLIGEPIEFRALGNSPPEMGTKWNCPQCDRAYFVIWRPAQWDHNKTVTEENWDEIQQDPHMSQLMGQFDSYEDFKKHYGVPMNANSGAEYWSAGFVLDLSYYESYNDEPGSDPDERRGLVTGDMTTWQWVW